MISVVGKEHGVWLLVRSSGYATEHTSHVELVSAICEALWITTPALTPPAEAPPAGDDTARLTKDDALSATLRFLDEREPFGLLGLKKMVRKALAIGEKGADHEPDA